MKAWLVLGVLSMSASSFGMTNEACIISFYGNETAGRKRAQKILSAKLSGRSTRDAIRAAKDTESIVTVGPLSDPAQAHVGFVWKVQRRSFQLGTRFGELVNIPFAERGRYIQIESPATRQRRYELIKAQASVTERTLIEDAERAQLQNREVEIRYTAAQYSRYFRQSFTGRLRLVDIREVWEQSDAGLVKRPDRIAIGIVQSILRTQLISMSGSPLLTLPSLPAPVPALFDLTGPEAIQSHQFVLLD